MRNTAIISLNEARRFYKKDGYLARALLRQYFTHEELIEERKELTKDEPYYCPNPECPHCKADIELMEETKELTKKWRDLDEIHGYFVSGDSQVHELHEYAKRENKNIYAEESQAKAALAMAMLSQIAKECNDRANWKADWEKRDQDKWCIIRGEGILRIVNPKSHFYHISFHSKEAAEESLVKHEALWKDYWEL